MKKSKIAALALAGTLTATAMLAGTYAWISYDHVAINEVIDVTNPGGRLHDDFNFTNNGNKDIYVENFTTTADKGTQIYARIRLDEYMEIGAKAGQYLTAAEGKDVRIIQDVDDTTIPEFEDRETWTTYLWGREKKQESGTPITVKADELSEFRKYILWETGGETVYLPTFNRNKDSLESDVNGTYEGLDGIRNDADPYTDNTTYTAGDSISSIQVLDADTSDHADELKEAGITVDYIIAAVEAAGTGQLDTAKFTSSATYPMSITVSTDKDIDNDPTTADTLDLYAVAVFDDSNNLTSVKINVDHDTDGSTDVTTNTEQEWDIEVSNATHTATDTIQNATLISMEEWKAAYNSEKGDYWVYDEDGWVYWANPIDPETATGLLLDRIYVRADADLTEEYYYAINVVAQFATAGDWGSGTFTTIADGNIIEGSGTGFYEKGITENGLYLLETIRSAEKTVTISTITMPQSGLNGDAARGTNTATFSASVHQGAAVLAESVTWDVEGETDANTTIVTEADGTGTLTIGATESADSITVVAKTTGTDVAVGTLLVPIGDYYEITVTMEQPMGASAVSTLSEEPAGYLGQGSIRTFTAEVKKNGVVNYDVGVEWLVSGNDPAKTTEITTAGVLRIASDEPTGNELTVTARCKADGTTTSEPYAVGSVMGVFDYINLMEAGTTETITIDGYDWYVMAKDNSEGQTKVLLWTNNDVKIKGEWVKLAFNEWKGGYTEGNEWEGSAVQKYLNGDFKATLETLTTANAEESIIVPTTLYTRKEFNVLST